MDERTKKTSKRVGRYLDSFSSFLRFFRYSVSPDEYGNAHVALREWGESGEEQEEQLDCFSVSGA